jgi:hypothetical protein
MALSGPGAMILYYDIAPEAIEEHDDWHTHEHFPERLSIPGFLRASRWIATAGGPRYLVMYEVADVQVLSAAPYLERLNNPTPWTAKMMENFRGMARGFCRVVSSCGLGLGHALHSMRYAPIARREDELREWLKAVVLPALAAKPGAASAWMLEPAAAPPMTNEQAMRGRDADIPWVLLVTGYNAAALSRIAEDDLRTGQFERHGASAAAAGGSYRLDYLLTAGECAPRA